MPLLPFSLLQEPLCIYYYLAPEEEIRDTLTYYYHLGLNDTDVAENCRDHIDQDRYGLSTTSVKRLRKKWGLLSTRQQKHTRESIAAKIQEIRKLFPLRGAETIRKQLRLQHNIRVSRAIISEYLKETEPEAVQARRSRRFKRKRFYAAGVNALWAQDQHDKWGTRFGLWFHNNIDPFTGYNNWLKVWWTNSNPRLIGKFYLDAVRELGAIPVTTQSDPGVENYGVANIHTTARHELDPSLVDTLQHRFKHGKTNVKSEGNWSVFRRDFVPGFEDLFEHGVSEGWYNIDNILERLVFRWLAIPWIQARVDEWLVIRNRTPPRANKHKVIPHGIPEMIRRKPERFNALDFKIPVPMELLDRLEQEYSPPDHPVFQLTPPEFHQRADCFYLIMGQPEVTVDTFWPIYRQLLAHVSSSSIPGETVFSGTEEFATILSEHQETIQDVDNRKVDEMNLLPGLKELREGADIVGKASGCRDSDGGSTDYADFTTTDEE